MSVQRHADGSSKGNQSASGEMAAVVRVSLDTARVRETATHGPHKPENGVRLPGPLPA